VWLGTAGAVTQMHHDTDLNFYAQLHGEKTFLLYEPSARHEAVYAHPRLHPLSHAPLPRPPSAAEAAAGRVYPPHELVGAPRAQRATLSRGDVLYIPPFWGHLATCERECISANIWWASEYQLVERRLERLPLPFELEWEAPLRDGATVAYLAALVRRAVADAEPLSRAPADALDALLEGRWRHPELLPAASVASVGCDVPTAAPPGLREKIAAYAATRADELRAVEPLEIRLIVLHDQLEAIVRTMGSFNASRAHALLRATRACLAGPSAPEARTDESCASE
jgi:hypothetical protein